jgi:transposase
MIRLLLTDKLWLRLVNAIKETNAYQTDNLRLTLEGILWRFRTGAPWRDLPNEFGPWKTVFNRFNTWSKSGIWQELFELIRGELDNEWNFMDGTYIKAHQHASGGIELNSERSIGRSKGGNTTKFHMLTDAHGNPATFEITLWTPPGIITEFCSWYQKPDLGPEIWKLVRSQYTDQERKTGRTSDN